MRNFFKEQSNKNFTILAVSLMFLLGSVLVAYNFNIFDAGASHSGSAGGINDVHSGASKQINSSLSGSSCTGANCRTISNSSANPTVMVPLGSPAEWCTFLQRIPSGVSWSSCYTYPYPYPYPTPAYGYPYPYPTPPPPSSCTACGATPRCCENWPSCGNCQWKSMGICCQ